MKHAMLRGCILLIISMPLTGCVALALGAAATAGASGAVYAKGQLKETLDGTVSEVHRAASAAVTEIGVELTVDQQDEFTGKVQGEMAGGTNVWVTSERVTAATTRVTIRVGYIGDQAKSADILERTKRRLYGL